MFPEAREHTFLQVVPKVWPPGQLPQRHLGGNLLGMQILEPYPIPTDSFWEWGPEALWGIVTSANVREPLS